MQLSTALGESWPELIYRVNCSNKLPAWQQQEPALDVIDQLEDLHAVTAVGADPARSDAVLGGLIRLAACDGGDDTDAALVILHLLRPGLSTLRNRFRRAGVSDAEALVVGQAMIQIRSFPWQQRTRAHAANILRDTGKALAREFMPNWSGREVLLDPQRYDQVCDLARDLVPGSSDEVTEADLRGLMDWVRCTGAVSTYDLELLLDYTARRIWGGPAHAGVAAARGISVRTCKRHCAAALAALRSAAPDYLVA